MSEYTPTTEEIRRDYAAYLSMESGEEFYGDAIPEEDARARFDRMIAEVERAAAEKALEGAAEDVEGIKNAARDGMNKFGPYPWHAAEGVADWLHARAAEIRAGAAPVTEEGEKE